jgi:hypothetical protein
MINDSPFQGTKSLGQIELNDKVFMIGFTVLVTLLMTGIRFFQRESKLVVQRYFKLLRQLILN